MSMWFASLKETEDSGDYTERRQSASPKQNSKKHDFCFRAFRLVIFGLSFLSKLTECHYLAKPQALRG